MSEKALKRKKIDFNSVSSVLYPVLLRYSYIHTLGMRCVEYSA